MCAGNESLNNIPPESAVLWRYLDLAKFLSLLDKQSLFFPLLAHLRRADPYEGSFPTANYLRAQEIATTMAEELPSDTPAEMRELTYDHWSSPLVLDHDVRVAGEQLYVSCWHESDHQSLAMWQLYARSGAGVAIRTTVARLRDSFLDTPKEKYIARVRYRDNDGDPLKRGDLFALALRKVPSYEHEREVRVIVQPGHPTGLPGYIPNVGFYIPCDLDLLIDKIYVAPGTESWMREAIASLLGKYGLKLNVLQSPLDAPAPSRALLLS